MLAEIFWGALFGFSDIEWRMRLILPLLVASYRCLELLILRAKSPLPFPVQLAMRHSGVSKAEVAEMSNTLRQVDDSQLQQAGISRWMLYPRQFAWSYITTLAFVLVGWLIRLIFFR